MKSILKISLAILLSGVLMMSCSKDDSVLAISETKAENHDGGGSEVKRGGTLEVNFKATAGPDARLDYYHIEIHDHPASGKKEDEYKIIDDSFKGVKTFEGLKEASVHQHVSVPADANLGKYHVVIVVVDKNGKSVDTENAVLNITVKE